MVIWENCANTPVCSSECHAWHRILQIKSYAWDSYANNISEGVVICYWCRRLIKTKTQTSPGARVSICHMPNTPPFGTQLLPKESLWGLQHSQSGLLKYTAWQIKRTTIQCPSLDWDSQGVNRLGETHSTLINTWPHYLSHVAKFQWGIFNTALLSWGMVEVSTWFCVWNLCIYVWRSELMCFVLVYLCGWFCLYMWICGCVCLYTHVYLCIAVCAL